MARKPNPAMKKLGLSPKDRAVILHADDVGMCRASVDAYADIEKAGILTSGAVMVPCPWFPAAASLARERPGADLGVHLTLTSEWRTYRWGPISTRDPSSGLLDAEGYFPRKSEMVQRTGTREAVGAELEAQIARAREFGIDPTHIDTHMGSVACANYMGIYLNLAVSNRLPAMAFRFGVSEWRKLGLDPQEAEAALRLMENLEASGYPLLDGLFGMPLDTDADRLERTKKALSGLEPGITHFIIHPSVDSPELRAITPDWACRAADYRDFMDESLAKHIKGIGIRPIGYRALRELIPKT